MHPTKKPRTLHDGDITIVEFGDEFEHLGEDVMPAVAQSVHDAGEAIVPKVLLDLSSVKFFGSSFIEVLYRLWKQMESRQGRFAISGLHPYCKEVLEVTNLDKLWTITPDRESGLAALRAEPTKS
jgi:anti-sigma B factor antagonist